MRSTPQQGILLDGRNVDVGILELFFDFPGRPLYLNGAQGVPRYPKDPPLHNRTDHPQGNVAPYTLLGGAPHLLI